jgi:hypothetical protein
MARFPTTTSRKAIGIVVLCVLLLVALVALRPRQVPDLSAYCRIQEGMSEAEVAAIFGAAADGDSCWLFDFPNSPVLPGTAKYWYCDAGVVGVHFDPQGKADYFSHRTYGFKGKPSLWQSFLRSVGL